MNKYEFLDQLGAALSGEVPSEEINSQLEYYNVYIKEKSLNMNEKEVIKELGNPRLIAKTIIDGYERAYGYSYKAKSSNNYHEQWDSSGHSSSTNYNKDLSKGSKSFDQGYNRQDNKVISWYVKLLVTLVIALIIILVIILGTVLIRILLLLIPIVIVTLLIIFLIRLFRNT